MFSCVSFLWEVRNLDTHRIALQLGILRLALVSVRSSGVISSKFRPLVNPNPLRPLVNSNLLRTDSGHETKDETMKIAAGTLNIRYQLLALCCLHSSQFLLHNTLHSNRLL
jgi:hypothetical protein